MLRLPRPIAAAAACRTRHVSTTSVAHAAAAEPAATVLAGVPFPALPPGGLALEAIANGSYAAQVAPDSYYLTHRMMETIDHLHHVGGLEWWQTILALTVAIRVASFPLTLFSMRNAAALGRIKPQTDILMEQATKCDVNTPDGMRRHGKVRAELWRLYSVNSCSPLYSLAPILLQMPVFIFMFSALQAMGNHKPGHAWLGLDVGGIGWFTDLTVPDPYYILPVAASGTFLLQTLFQDTSMSASKEQTQMMQYAGIGMSVLFLPLMATTGSITVLYFAATNTIGVTQAALLRAKPFRRLMGLPIPPGPDSAKELERAKPPQIKVVQYFRAPPPRISTHKGQNSATSEASPRTRSR